MAKKAICIGIDNYPGTNMDLQMCKRDAKAWARELRARGFSVSTLYDSRATLAAMTKALTSLVSKAEPGDFLVFQFSGHGTWVPDLNGDEKDKRDEALVPYDIMTSGPLIDDVIFSIVNKKKPGVKVCFISDSCHSGTVLRAFPGEFGYRGTRKFMPFQVFNKSAARKVAKDADIYDTYISEDSAGFRDMSGVMLGMFGCQDDEYSYDSPELGNGAFTYYALQVLRQLPENATYRQWHKRLRYLLPNQSYPQTPNLYGVGTTRKIFE